MSRPILTIPKEDDLPSRTTSPAELERMLWNLFEAKLKSIRESEVGLTEPGFCVLSDLLHAATNLIVSPNRPLPSFEGLNFDQEMMQRMFDATPERVTLSLRGRCQPLTYNMYQLFSAAESACMSDFTVPAEPVKVVGPPINGMPINASSPDAHELGPTGFSED